VQLGNPTRLPPKATPETRAKGSATNAEQAQAFAERLRPVLTELDGLSLRTVARELERRGIATVRGGKWTRRSGAQYPSRRASEPVISNKLNGVNLGQRSACVTL
jgi:hypothetical protein